MRLYQARTHTGGETRASVVLVHGVGGTLANWDRVVSCLPPGLDVIGYDLRGHGRSDRPDGPYSLDLFVQDHRQVLAENGLAAAHVAGESLGGLITEAIGLQAPETAQSLVMLAAVAGRTEAQKQSARERCATLLRDGIDRTWLEGSAQRWFTPEFAQAHPEVVGEFLDRIAANDPRSYAAAFRVLTESDLVDQLHEIGSPTLVVTGEGDVGSTPEMSRLIAARIAGARVRILPGVKHLPTIEQPHVVAELISEFVLSVGNS